MDQSISRLNSACYAIRAVKALLSRKAVRMLYFSYVHSFKSFGINFWDITPNSIIIFIMQKKIKNYN